MDDNQNQTPAADSTPAEAPAEEPKAKEAKPAKEVSGKVGEIMGQIESLSVLELSDLVHALEDKFGVSASAAAPVAAAAGGAAAGGEAASEQTTFNVVLTESGANKISVIKAVRELVPTLGLKEAKDLVDAPPKNVLEGANKEAANEAKTRLEAAGAKVELK
jgi:large subunit ribosomal protein L7/L12